MNDRQNRIYIYMKSKVSVGCSRRRGRDGVVEVAAATYQLIKREKHPGIRTRQQKNRSPNSMLLLSFY